MLPELLAELERISTEVNRNNTTPDAAVVARRSNAISTDAHMVALSPSVKVPRTLELLRILETVKQRFGASESGNVLVGRLRFDAIPRTRPIRSVSTFPTTEQEAVAKLSPYPEFSRFQVDGWAEVLRSVENRSGLVITAPTGAGKTEVFVLPLIYSLLKNPTQRFILVYPRIALLEDQLARVLSAAYFARQQGHVIPVGIQFGSVKRSDQLTVDNQYDDDGSPLFESGEFQSLEECPVCGAKVKLRLLPKGEQPYRELECPDCKKTFAVSISREGHIKANPPIMVTTAESLDSFYLRPEFEPFLTGLSGIVIDEAHLYDSLYGVHVHQLINRLKKLVGKELTLIAASATISDPIRFASRLFYGSDQGVRAHEALSSAYEAEQELGGIEGFVTLQTPTDESSPAPSSLLIQCAMALGHAFLTPQEKVIIFADSLDQTGRFFNQLRDAEHNQGLWAFRTVVEDISYPLNGNNEPCPRKEPMRCDIYSAGECWRGIHGGKDCYEPAEVVSEEPLSVAQVTSKTGKNLSPNLLVASPTLEVGVDNEQIKAVVQYRPPRSLAGFTQRRGRAGRKQGDLSHSILILGNDAPDNFALFRRQRLLNGVFDIPLNTDNAVIQQLHERLERDRSQYAKYYQQNESFPPKAIARYILDQLEACPTLSAKYQEDFDNFRDRFAGYFDLSGFKDALIGWADRELERTGPILDLRRHLTQLRSAFPTELMNDLDAFREQIDNYLAGGAQPTQRLTTNSLISQVSQILVDEPERAEHLAEVVTLLTNLRAHLYNLRRTGEGSISDYERLHNFFFTLKEHWNKGWSFQSSPQDIKVTLGSLYYLHAGVDAVSEPSHTCVENNCPVSISSLLPSSYFQTVKPLRFEKRYSSGSSDYIEEQVSNLASLYLPYRLTYRHYGDTTLATLDTEHHPDWVDGSRVRVRLPIEGLSVEGGVRPQIVPLRGVRTDRQGRQVVKFCKQCYKVHSLSKRVCECGGQLEFRKLYAQPYLERRFENHTGTCISERLRVFEGQGRTRVLGSDVESHRYLKSNSNDRDADAEYFRASGDPDRFEVRYLEPMVYTIDTQALGWQLDDLLNELSEGRAQPQQLRGVALATARELLHRAVASVVGVHREDLESAIGDNNVSVWEVFEGGAGLIEVFQKALEADALQVYQELLRVVLCPVGLAEEALRDGIDAQLLRTRTVARLNLPDPQSTLPEDIFVEVSNELTRLINQRASGEPFQYTCLETDGCPVCVGTQQIGDEEPSRLLAESILSRLIIEMSNKELSERAREGKNLPMVLESGAPNRVLSL